MLAYKIDVNNLEKKRFLKTVLCKDSCVIFKYSIKSIRILFFIFGWNSKRNKEKCYDYSEFFSFVSIVCHWAYVFSLHMNYQFRILLSSSCVILSIHTNAFVFNMNQYPVLYYRILKITQGNKRLLFADKSLWFLVKQGTYLCSSILQW